MEDKEEMGVTEQILWYLERLDERQLKSVLLYVFKLFLKKI